MRPEKQFLVDEVSTYLEKSDYVFLTNFERITVAETADLRSKLAEVGAEFHVIKNSVFHVASQQHGLPDLSDHLTGQTALVLGGDNAPGAAKVLKKFFKDKEKVEVKVGVLENAELSREQVDALAELPSKEVLQAQLLGLLNQPAQRLVTVLAGVPRAMVTVLKAYADEKGAA